MYNFKAACRASCLGLLLSFTYSASCQIYVDANNTSGIEDGLSWATAYTSLQSILETANFGDVFWVAEGIYTPHPTDQNKSFELKNGVKLIGGFPTGGNITNRDPNFYQTILSGEIGNAGISDNSYSVLYSKDISVLTVIDGFYIVGGYSTGNCFDGSSTSRQKFGGAWFNRNGSPIVQNCVFQNNRSDCGGGAIYNDGGSTNNASPLYYNCKFIGNYSDQDGGALYNNGNGGTASPIFENCEFRDNASSIPNGSHGATIFNFGKSGNSNTSLTNCLFANNTGFAGAGVYNLASGGNANINVTNCTFYNNYAEQGAGAIYVNADTTGASNGGSAIATIRNTIFWLNQANQFPEEIFKMVDGEINIQHCIADAADCASMSTGDGQLNCIGNMLFDNVNNDPLFNNPGTGDFTLQTGSAAINFGNNSFNGTTKDLAGFNRVQQSTIDLGPLESPFAPLAVELTTFTAHRSEDIIILDWETISESNHDFFEIEKSQDGIYFSTIGNVSGKNKYNTNTDYNFKDEQPFSGSNYYRLKSVDRSGGYQYTPVRQVIFSTGTIIVYPNPTREFINIQSDYKLTHDVGFHIANAQGQVIYRGILEAQNYDLFQRFDIPHHWRNGLYFLHIDQSALITAPIKFVLQKDY